MIAMISSGTQQATFSYGPDLQRWQTMTSDDGTPVRRVLYGGDYERVIYAADSVREFFYLGHDIIAVRLNGGPVAFYMAQTDHLGSIVTVRDSLWASKFHSTYDAWGNPSVSENTIGLLRGYTGHEMLPEYGLINMNGRLYDPQIGRFLSPDNYVQMPDLSQSFNRYSYCLNNPLKYVDEDGEFAWIPIIAGAIIGTYAGGVIANNGSFNPTKWDYGSGKTWRYMLGGGVFGGISGGIGGAISASGIPFANTLGIATASLTNSIGTWVYTGGNTPITISLGIASYDFSNREWGYLWKKGNSKFENIGYFLGAMGNVSDILIGMNPKKVDLVTEHSDAIGHSAIVESDTYSGVSHGDPNALISVGPINDGSYPKGWHWEKGTNQWISHSAKGEIAWRQTLNVNRNTIQRYSNWLNNLENKSKLIYSLEVSSCVTHTSIALNLSGLFNIGIHPFILNSQMFLWNMGIRPWSYSFYGSY